MAEHPVVATDDRFFDALMRADSVALDHLLVDDFILVDVLSGSEIEKAALVSLVGSGQLTFDEIRRYRRRWSRDAPVWAGAMRARRGRRAVGISMCTSTTRGRGAWRRRRAPRSPRPPSPHRGRPARQETDDRRNET